MGLQQFLPSSWKQFLRARQKHWRSLIIRRLFSFTPDDLLAALRSLGVQPGAVLMVHSSFAHFEGFTGGAGQAVSVLQEAVGPSGLLMMPTMPFPGSALAYVRSGVVTDIRRTPSQMGLLSEVFRRRPDVLRSIHPTHPVAAWGDSAAEAIANHHLAGTPCGRGTPFEFLLNSNGSILLAGASIESLTYFHYLEEVLEPLMPFSPFTSEFFDVQTRGPDGEQYNTRTRLFEPSVSARRNLPGLEAPLRQAAAWRQTRLGRLSLILISAAAVLEAVQTSARRGEYFYRPPE